ncbi:MAG: hypothetical protein QW752_05350 [Thermoplasmata archaeon]
MEYAFIDYNAGSLISSGGRYSTKEFESVWNESDQFREDLMERGK